MEDWARVPEPKAIKKETINPACEDETASRDMTNGGDAAEKAACAVARIARLEGEYETDVICHHAAREEDRAQINELVEIVAYLCDHINQMHGVMPAD